MCALFRVFLTIFLIALVGCKPDKPDVVQMRIAQAQERMAKASNAATSLNTTIRSLPPELARLPVFQLGDREIVLGDVYFQLSQRSDYERAQFRTMEDLVKLVLAIAERELLVAAALEAGLQKLIQVQFVWKQALMTEWLSMFASAGEVLRSITNDDLRAYYAKHSEDFRTQAWRRVAMFFHHDEAEVKALAEETRKRIADNRDDGIAYFTAQVALRSKNQKLAASGGDLGWVDSEGLDEQGRRVVSTLVRDELVKLNDVGRVSELLKIAGYHHVIVITDKRLGRIPSFDEAILELKSAVLKQRQQAIRAEHVAKLLGEAEVTVDEAQLARLVAEQRVQVKPKAPAATVPRDGTVKEGASKSNQGEEQGKAKVQTPKVPKARDAINRQRIRRDALTRPGKDRQRVPTMHEDPSINMNSKELHDALKKHLTEPVPQ